jgi:hypothetical protein
MTLDWQDVAALTVVAAAAALLGWRAWSTLSARQRAGCGGGCGSGCSSGGEREPALVELATTPPGAESAATSRDDDR